MKKSTRQILHFESFTKCPMVILDLDDVSVFGLVFFPASDILVGSSVLIGIGVDGVMVMTVLSSDFCQ